jgi:hypothetical protein
MNKENTTKIHIVIYKDSVSMESALILVSKFILSGDRGVVRFGNNTLVGKREHRKSNCYYVWKDEEELA